MSWAGLLERSDCADSLIVKHFKGDNTNDFMMSDPLDTATNSYIVRDVVPNQMYTYQVIFRREGSFHGILSPILVTSIQTTPTKTYV